VFLLEFMLDTYPEEPMRSIPIYTDYKYIYISYLKCFTILVNLRRYKIWI
jgi:hypothetical protein